MKNGSLHDLDTKQHYQMNQNNWLKTVNNRMYFFLWKPNKPTKSRDNTIMKFIKVSQLPPPLWCAIFDICPELGNVLLLWWCPLWKPTRPLAPPGGSRFWLLCCKERDISAADVTQVRSSRLEHLESNNKIKIDSWFLNLTKEDYLGSVFLNLI